MLLQYQNDSEIQKLIDIGIADSYLETITRFKAI